MPSIERILCVLQKILKNSIFTSIFICFETPSIVGHPGHQVALKCVLSQFCNLPDKVHLDPYEYWKCSTKFANPLTLNRLRSPTIESHLPRGSLKRVLLIESLSQMRTCWSYLRSSEASLASLASSVHLHRSIKRSWGIFPKEPQ